MKAAFTKFFSFLARLLSLARAVVSLLRRAHVEKRTDGSDQETDQKED